MLPKNFNKITGWIIILISLTVSDVYAAGTITQNGITWTFDKNISTSGTAGTYQYGQFANGDHWVIGPVNITKIDPPCHITVAGEKDEDGVDYAYPNITGTGTWVIYWGGAYWRAWITTNDIANVSVGELLLVTKATGNDSAKVNYLAFKVVAKEAGRFSIEFFPNVPGLSNTSVISGGTFGGRINNGSEINPLATGQLQGYVSAANGYAHSLNAAWTISTDNPDKKDYLTVPVNSSLISTESCVKRAANGTSVQRAEILTVLPSDAFDNLPNSVTPSDCFRPHYFGTGNKAVLHYKTAIDDTFLGKLALVQEDTIWPTLAEMIEQFAHPWITVGLDINYAGIAPWKNMPFYYLQVKTTTAAVLLNCNAYTSEQKRPLLINYIQNGIDWFGQYVEGSHGNRPEGGQYSGHMLPMLAFGRAFNYQPVWDLFSKSGSYRYIAKPNTNPVKYYDDFDLPSDYNFIQELDQTFCIAQRDVDITNNLFRGVGQYLYGVPLWSPTNTTIDIGQKYTSGMIGIPEWGIRQAGRPDTGDARFPDSNYRAVQNSADYPTMQLMVLVWGLKEKVNHNAWFDYSDRWATYCISLDTPSRHFYATWKTYRHLYGPIWPNTATVPTTYTLSISATNGSVTKSPSKTVYNSGETVTLTAAANTGYIFGSWTGNVTGTTNPVTVTMNSNKSIIANFTQAPTTLPTGMVYQNTTETVFSGASDYQPISTSGWSLSGTTITLWANPSNITGVHYILGHTIAGTWSSRIQLYLDNSSLGLGLGDIHSRQTNLATVQTGQWYFISLSWNGTNYTVQINGQIAGTGSYTGLTALETFADIGNNGSAASRTEPFAGTIDDIRVYGRTLSSGETTAIYNYGRTTATPTTYTLSVTAANGTVVKSPNKTTYTSGETVTLTAAPNTGYSFGSWTGSTTGTTNPVTVTMNSNKTVTANFTQNTYTLTIAASNGTVAKSPNTATYTYGQVVTLTATANSGYSFGSWTGSAIGTTNPVTITMNGNKVVTANFTAIPYTLTITTTNGTVAKSPNTATYTYGQVVTLTATANAGYNFGSWTGDTTGTTSPVTVTINGNKAVTANFTALSMAESMTAHWMLDENTGSTVTDSTIAGRTAALINNPSWGYGWAGEDWISTANQTQAIAIPANALLPQAGSIAVWIEPDSTTGTQFIFGHVFNSSNRISLYSVAGKLALGLGANAALQTNIADLTAGQTVHIALTWSGTSYAVYVNAVQKITGTFEGLTALNATMDIGNYGDSAGRTVGFVGVIGDIRTYCRALTPTEMQRLYYTYDVHQQKTVVFTLPTTNTLGQPISYQPVALPAGAIYQSGTFTWQPSYNQTGSYTLVFTASGQPVRIITVFVHEIPLADWYRQFLVYTEKL